MDGLYQGVFAYPSALAIGKTERLRSYRSVAMHFSHVNF